MRCIFFRFKNLSQNGRFTILRLFIYWQSPGPLIFRRRIEVGWTVTETKNISNVSNDERIGHSDSHDLQIFVIFARSNQANQKVNSIWFVICPIQFANPWFTLQICSVNQANWTNIYTKRVNVCPNRKNIYSFFQQIFIWFAWFALQIDVQFSRFAQFTVEADLIHSICMIRFTRFASIRSIHSTNFPDSPIVKRKVAGRTNVVTTKRSRLRISLPHTTILISLFLLPIWPVLL